MQTSATNRKKRQEATASEKREQRQRESFLIREPDRDTPEFRNQFARWLAKCRTVPGVRECFNAEPDREASLAAARAWKPIAALRSKLDRAKTERQRQAFRNSIDQVMPPQIRQRISRHLERTHQRRRGEHRDRLTKELCERTPVVQIDWLNGYLHDLRSRGIASETISAITLEAVEGDYYFDREPCPVEQELKHTTFEIAFAGNVAAAWARRECEGEDLRLSEIIFALVPLWRPILAAYNRSPRQVRKFTKRLLQIHLRFWPASPRRSRRSPQQNAVTLLRAIRRATQQAAQSGDGPLTAPQLRALFRRVIAMPRAVPLCHPAGKPPYLDDTVSVPLPEQRVVVRFRSFFFPELSTKELHTRRELASKLRFHALKHDVPLLMEFLFYAVAGKARTGLFPHWDKVLTGNSKYRHEDAMLSNYDLIKVQKKRGTSRSHTAEEIATKVAGGKPVVKASNVKVRTDAFEKAWKRLPEKLQKRQAKRSDKSRR